MILYIYTSNGVEWVPLKGPNQLLRKEADLMYLGGKNLNLNFSFSSHEDTDHGYYISNTLVPQTRASHTSIWCLAWPQP